MRPWLTSCKTFVPFFNLLASGSSKLCWYLCYPRSSHVIVTLALCSLSWVESPQ